jgi:hypothetical protein
MKQIQNISLTHVKFNNILIKILKTVDLAFSHASLVRILPLMINVWFALERTEKK